MKYIKSFLELNENVNDNLLYHTTDLYNAVKILKENILKISIKNNNISFTRNKNFWYKDDVNAVRFIIDKTLLSNNYKIKSFDFFNNPKIKKMNKPYSDKWNKHHNFEYEEIVEKDIKNFMKYVVKIEISMSIVNVFDEYDSADLINKITELAKTFNKEIFFI